MSEHECIKEKEFGEIFTTLKFIKDFMEDIKDNHLHNIYNSLGEIKEKMNSRRPTYTMLVLISILSSLCVGLIVALVK